MLKDTTMFTKQLYKYFCSSFVKLPHPVKREPLAASYDEKWEEAFFVRHREVKWSVLADFESSLTSSTGQTDTNWAGLVHTDLQQSEL